MEYIDNPKFGIIIYKNQIDKNLNIPQRIEDIIAIDDTHEYFNWREALVGNQEKMPDYRDCWDFKISEEAAEAMKDTKYKDLFNIHTSVKTVLRSCMDDYAPRYNIIIDYMEAINFVKYEKGQHFHYHSDHGFSYVCTVSSIMYLNDGYEGGELRFDKLDITIKPEYGDVILFPSSYIYSHASLPVVSGVKYSAVTMFDFNDKFHQYKK